MTVSTYRRPGQVWTSEALRLQAILVPPEDADTWQQWSRARAAVICAGSRLDAFFEEVHLGQAPMDLTRRDELLQLGQACSARLAEIESQMTPDQAHRFTHVEIGAPMGALPCCS